MLATVWDDPRNIETLTTMWIEGKSASEIANMLGQGVTRNAVIGKVTRLKLPPHRQNRVVQVERPAQHGNKGHANGPVIAARIERRQRSLAAADRQHAGNDVHRAGSLPDMDGGVDFTGRIGFADRRIGKDCAWIPGDPLGGAVCCGKPVKEGTQWCPEHHARVYAGRPAQ